MFRSCLERRDFETVWQLVDAWESPAQRAEEVLPYLLSHLERDPLGLGEGAPFATWFEAMLYHAMHLEAYEDPELARRAYECCATFKPWCPPVVMGLERIRWFSSEPDEHLGSYQWWNLQDALWNRTWSESHERHQGALLEYIQAFIHHPEPLNQHTSSLCDARSWNFRRHAPNSRDVLLSYGGSFYVNFFCRYKDS